MKLFSIAFLSITTFNIVLGDSIIPGAFLIEYAGQSAIGHTQILSALKPLSHLFRVRQTYASSLFNGLSIHLENQSEDGSYPLTNHPVLKQLLASPSVQRIYPVYNVPRPEWVTDSRTNDNDQLPFENSQTQLGTVRSEYGLTGAGVTVGLIDSGVDYYHPALGGGFGEGYKIRLGHNLVDPATDDAEAGTHRSADDPYDPCPGTDGGHGTHATGIIGAVDPAKNFIGVAPNATLGMWRIFGCAGGADEDVVIKAMEMAYEAGCDVINLSLGVQTAWPENAMAVVADRLVQKGVHVVSVAGNQGPEGIIMQNSPGSGKHVISAASVDNSFYLTQAVSVDTLSGELYPYVLSTSTEVMLNGTLAVDFDDQQQVTNACQNASTSAKGDILLVRRGACTYDEKLSTAKKAGAIGVVFYDPNGGPGEALATHTSDGSLPSAGIPKELAYKLIELAQKRDSLQITFSTEKKMLVMQTAGKVSSFSSVGPTYELDLKPNLAGIGSRVYSTLPRHIDGGWGIKSGTSMAAPHVAGVVALMIEWYRRQGRQHPDPVFITEQLQNHALLATFEDAPDHPLLQGAGLVQPSDAVRGALHVSPGCISFNDTASAEGKTHVLTIQNYGHDTISVSMRYTPSKSISMFGNQSTFAPTEPIQRSNTSVELTMTPQHLLSLGRGQSEQVIVSVQLPKDADHAYQMYGGFIELMSFDQILARVPYFGVLGRMRDLPIFDKGYPYIAPSGNIDVRYNSTDAFFFNITSGPQPTIVCRLLTAAAQVHIEVLDSHQQEVLGEISGGPFTYWERNRLSDAAYYRTVDWNGDIVLNYDGLSTPIQVERGTYFIRTRALKLLGYPDNPNDWEYWMSGPIVVST